MIFQLTHISIFLGVGFECLLKQFSNPSSLVSCYPFGVVVRQPIRVYWLKVLQC